MLEVVPEGYSSGVCRAAGYLGSTRGVHEGCLRGTRVVVGYSGDNLGVLKAYSVEYYAILPALTRHSADTRGGTQRSPGGYSRGSCGILGGYRAALGNSPRALEGTQR